MTAVSAVTVGPEPLAGSGPAVNADLLDPDRWRATSGHAGGCAKPVRLTGRMTTVDEVTGVVLDSFDTRTLPDGMLYKACGDRREANCPACAAVYRSDATHLVRAGLLGGKGVPDSVRTHPCLFVTLTAPSFGLVHNIRTGPDGKARPCRPRRKPTRCPHGVELRCSAVHRDGDPAIGAPLCPDCYDYAGQVVWNSRVGDLWRRTLTYVTRAINRRATRHGRRVKLSYAKVAEFQARGVVHLHMLVRLDGRDPDNPDAVIPPPVCMTADEVVTLLRTTLQRVSFRTAGHPHNPAGWDIRWGQQTDIRIVRSGPNGTITDTHVVGYLVKYTTKSTESAGGLVRPLWCRDCNGTGLAGICIRCDGTGMRCRLDDLEMTGHVRRMIETAWTLGYLPAHYPEHRDFAALRRWAHVFGFRGHVVTKSRRYSIPFKVLRAARTEHRRALALAERPADEVTGEHRVTKEFRYLGSGWLTSVDAQLAAQIEALARSRREARRLAYLYA